MSIALNEIKYSYDVNRSDECCNNQVDKSKKFVHIMTLTECQSDLGVYTRSQLIKPVKIIFIH